MNYQKERILSEGEIQSLYEQIQGNIKIIKECLKHNKTLLKDFGTATSEYGDKLEEISKRTITDMMKINTNKVLKEMSFQIKQIGSQIIGTSSSIKQLIDPLNNESKELKQSYNDYVKLIQQRKKDQEEQYKKLDEVKTKLGVYQRSIMPQERSTTPQYRQMKQQENMMIEEQKLKYQIVVQCKSDLSNFILEENKNIDKKILIIQSKCADYIQTCLDNYNKQFCQIAQVSQLLDGSVISQNQSFIKNNNSQLRKANNSNSQINNSPFGKSNKSQSPISRKQSANSQILQPLNNFDQRSTNRMVSNRCGISQKHQHFNSDIVESEDLSEMENKSSRTYKNPMSTMVSSNQAKLKKSQISNNSSNKSDNNNSKASLYNCKQFKSNLQSLNNDEYI